MINKDKKIKKIYNHKVLLLFIFLTPRILGFYFMIQNAIYYHNVFREKSVGSWVGMVFFWDFRVSDCILSKAFGVNITWITCIQRCRGDCYLALVALVSSSSHNDGAATCVGMGG